VSQLHSVPRHMYLLKRGVSQGGRGEREREVREERGRNGGGGGSVS
jgi:hypothetical protein